MQLHPQGLRQRINTAAREGNQIIQTAALLHPIGLANEIGELAEGSFRHAFRVDDAKSIRILALAAGVGYCAKYPAAYLTPYSALTCAGIAVGTKAISYALRTNEGNVLTGVMAITQLTEAVISKSPHKILKTLLSISTAKTVSHITSKAIMESRPFQTLTNDNKRLTLLLASILSYKGSAFLIEASYDALFAPEKIDPEKIDKELITNALKCNTSKTQCKEESLKVLGGNKDMSLKDIGKILREKSKELHPDKTKHLSAHEQQEKKELLSLMNTAMQNLKTLGKEKVA